MTGAALKFNAGCHGVLFRLLSLVQFYLFKLLDENFLALHVLSVIMGKSSKDFFVFFFKQFQTVIEV